MSQFQTEVLLLLGILVGNVFVSGLVILWRIGTIIDLLRGRGR